MRIEYDVFGDVQYSREIMRVGDRAGDMTPAFNAVADMIVDVERKQFASEGAYASSGWQPLAASTIEHKAKAGLAPEILQATRALHDSLTNPSDRHHVRRITPDEMFVGTNVTTRDGYPYPRAHQRGRGVPQRRVIELRPQDRTQATKTLQRYIMTGET